MAIAETKLSIRQFKAGSLLCAGKPALISNRQTSGLDKTLDVRT
jgi:hypothetical protein